MVSEITALYKTTILKIKKKEPPVNPLILLSSLYGIDVPGYNDTYENHFTWWASSVGELHYLHSPTVLVISFSKLSFTGSSRLTVSVLSEFPFSYKHATISMNHTPSDLAQI